jgi:hypothetical protein
MRWIVLLLFVIGCKSTDVSVDLTLDPSANKIEVQNARITIQWEG